MKKLAWKILDFLNKYIARPRMISGYTRHDGQYLPLTRISNTVAINAPHSFLIGDNVFIGHYNIIDASNQVTIEEGCQITNYVSILTHSSHHAIRLYGAHYIANNGRHLAYNRAAVIIGRYSFIGPHSVIMPGTRLGKGTLVAAYSLVKGEFDDFAILAGNPATVVGNTRELDCRYLEQYPQLKAYYQEWAND